MVLDLNFSPQEEDDQDRVPDLNFSLVQNQDGDGEIDDEPMQELVQDHPASTPFLSCIIGRKTKINLNLQIDN
jgi:hypothetical protein